MHTVNLFHHHLKLEFVLLSVVEAAILILSVLTAHYIELGGDLWEMELVFLWPKALFFAAILLAAMVAGGLYNHHLREGSLAIVHRLGISFFLGFLVLGVAYYAAPALYLERSVLIVAFASSFVAILLTRAIFSHLMTLNGVKKRILVLGTGQGAQILAEFLPQSVGKEVVGYLRMNGENPKIEKQLATEYEGSLWEYASRLNVDEVVVAVDERRKVLPTQALMECRIRGIEVTDLLTFLERETGKIKVDLVNPSWFTYSPGFFYRGVLRKSIKRSMDLVGGSIVLLLTWPIMLVTALAILAEGPRRGPIFYRQTRVGESGREFQIIKFRSMCVDAEQKGEARWAAEGDPRITRVGRVSRKYRIDELPQVFNILQGEMSFVGPRPERPEFENKLLHSLPYYSERYRVKPGLTGWAQICYPYGASEKDAFEKLQYDLYYVKNYSLFLDLMILLQTSEIVLWGEGAR